MVARMDGGRFLLSGCGSIISKGAYLKYKNNPIRTQRNDRAPN
jgi:uncharacterized protein YceK